MSKLWHQQERTSRIASLRWRSRMKFKNLGGIGQRVLNFLDQIRIAVLADGDVVDIGNLRADGIQAGFHRERGKSAEVLVPVQTLFGNGEFHFSIDAQSPPKHRRETC